MPGYYDVDGRPMQLMDWAKKFEEGSGNSDRHIAQKKLWFGYVWISTVWLGLDHDFTWTDLNNPNPNPLIFESMVFIRGRGYEMRRWHTAVEAAEEHLKMVRKYRNPINLYKMWKEWR